ncbi:MAG TPA: hypothetical protein VNN80_18600, partial [Polyangiaceae bacterium]|nr:hypothetical protein [Polyangiaceae bacterium]
LDDAATPQHPAPDKPNAGLDTILGIPRPPVDGAVPRPVPSGSGTIIACRVPSNEESRKLREIVLRVCSAEDLQIIAHDLGMPLERIVSPQVGFELQALRLIEWSMNHERVEDLKSLISARSPSAFRAG